MRTFLLIFIVLLTIPDLLLAASSLPRSGVVTSVTGHDVVIRLDDANGLQPGDPVILASPRAAIEPAPTPASAKVPAALRMIGPKFKGKAVGLALADLDGDQELEIAIAFEERVEIGRWDGKVWTRLNAFDLPGALRVLGLDAADLDADGRAELLITAVHGELLSSQIWSCSREKCSALASALPWYFRVIDLPGQGRVPFGQKDDLLNNRDYNGPLFPLSFASNKMQTGPPLLLPSPLVIHGSQPFPFQGELLWAGLERSDELTVTSAAGERLWESREKFGGSEAYIDKPDKDGRRGETRRLFIRSRLLRDNDTVIVPKNDGIRTQSRRRAEESRLVGLHWNGYALDELWSTPLRDGYLADVVKSDFDRNGEADYLLVGTLATGLFSAPQSALFLWENQP